MKPQINSSDYQLHLPPLGEGTYGTVYRATYRGVAERAVKVFKPGRVDLPSMMRELEKLSTVAEHQGIVTLHDFDLRGEVPYYAMSLHAERSREGAWKARTLEELCGQVEAREAARLIDQIADAMAYLHRHQVLHCDLKPRNIMLTDETPPHVKISDFGQSRSLSWTGLAGGGTPFYSSPEQLLHPDDWMEGKGFLWDVYSFGVVCYKLVTGRLPRLQSLAEAATEQNREGTVEESGSEGAGEGEAPDILPEELVQRLRQEEEVSWPRWARLDRRRRLIIARCLDLDPKVRPGDMREVRNAIYRQQQESRAVRSRNMAILFGAITAVALGASGKALSEAQRARAANVREEEKRREAEELVNFIVHNLSENLEPAGRAELLEHIAGNAATYFSNMTADSQTERSLRSFARVLETRGWAALARGDGELAADSYQKALNLYQQMGGADAGGANQEVAEILEKLGNAQALAGNFEAAGGTWQSALQRLGEDQERPEHWLFRSRIHRQLANLERRAGKYEKAVKEIGRAQEYAEKADKVPELRQSVAALEGYLGIMLEGAELLHLAGQFPAARETFLRVAARVEEDTPVLSKAPVVWVQAAQAYRALSDLALVRVDPDPAEARTFLERELELREAYYWREPMEVVRSLALAQCLASLASCLPRESEEERKMGVAQLKQALRCLDGAERAGATGNRIEVLRQECLNQLRELQGGERGEQG